MLKISPFPCTPIAIDCLVHGIMRQGCLKRVRVDLTFWILDSAEILVESRQDLVVSGRSQWELGLAY